MQLLLVTLVITGMLSCFPVIENVTPSRPVDPALKSFVTDQGPILVLPMWNEESGGHNSCNTRSPFKLQASEIMNLNDHLEPRHRFGLMDMAGHGPSSSRYMSGLLLFFPGARLLWVRGEHSADITDDKFYWRPRYRGEYGSKLKEDLERWLASDEGRPPTELDLDRLMTSCDKYRVKMSKAEEQEVLGFLDSDPFSMRPVAFSGWLDVGTGSSSGMNPVR